MNDLTKTDYFHTNRKNSENEPQSVKANDLKTNKIESFYHNKKKETSKSRIKNKFKIFFILHTYMI
jgi:hypothetical protein